MPASLKLFASDRCFVQELINYFCTKDQKDFSDELLILPTQRLGTRFVAALGQELSSYIPPKIMTLESLLLTLSAEPPNLLEESSIELMILEIIKNSSLDYVTPGQEREIRLLIGEMFDNHIIEQAFKNGELYLKDNIYHSDQHIDSLGRRLNEIKAVIDTFMKHISQLGKKVKQQYFADIAATSEPAIEELLNRYSRCCVVGMTSLARSWYPLIAGMSRCENVDFWLTKPQESKTQVSPLAHIVDFLSPVCEVEWQKNEDSKEHASQIILSNNSSPLHEIINARKIADTYIQQGVSPANIGIILSQEGLYGQIVESLADSNFANDNLAMTRSLQRSSFGQWLSKFLTAMQSNFKLEPLFDWLKDPITSHYLEANQLKHSWQMNYEVITQGFYDIYDYLASELVDESMAAEFQAFLNAFPEERLSLVSWVEYLNDICKTFQVESFLEDNFREATLTILKNFNDSMVSIDQLTRNLYSRDEFCQILNDQLLNQDLRQIGEPLEGVQVLSLSESRYYPFDVLILIGANEGFFPKAIPKDELLDNHLKKQMGFLGWEYLESMEDQTFYLIKNRIPQIILSRCQYIDSVATVRSRFADRLAAEKRLDPVSEHLSVRDLWSLEELPGETEEFGKDHYPLDPGDLTYVSASRLTKLINCPLQFYISQQRIDVWKFRDPNDKRDEGNWLHKVVEKLFEKTPPTFSDIQQYKNWLLIELESLTIKHGPTSIDSKPLFYQLKLHAWPALANHLIKIYDGQWHRFSEAQKELPIKDLDNQKSVSMTINESRRFVGGTIDSLDKFQSGLVLTDFKRKRLPSKTETSCGTQPQIGLYALCLEASQYATSPVIAGFWSILLGEWQCHGISPELKDEAMKKGLAGKQSPDIQSIRDGVKRIWQWRESSLLEETAYYADPSQCGMCQFSSVCRKDSPDQSDYVASQDRLHQYLETLR
ncbi:MAG: PD-(D/E)XK nuclease family protein [Pseudobacteriovorax sp.]|nr:PD-(D/E)XK nuclease family protein [Pseudobacteriovorax sp.]